MDPTTLDRSSVLTAPSFPRSRDGAPRRGSAEPARLGWLPASDPPRERRSVLTAAAAAILLHLLVVALLVWATSGDRARSGVAGRVAWVEDYGEEEPVIIFFGSPAAAPQAPQAPQTRAEQPGGPAPAPLVTPEGGAPPLPPAGETGAGAEEAPGGGGGGAPATAAEALRPRAGDPRLWAPIETLPTPKSERERAVERVYARIRQFNDSILAEAEAARRVTDWTVTDKNGGRWGISPGKLHLGKLTLPLPFGFQAPPGRREETAERLREWSEIEDQARRAQIRDQFNERVKQMRARKEKERQESKEREDTASGS